MVLVWTVGDDNQLRWRVAVARLLHQHQHDCIKTRGWRNMWGWKQHKNYNASYCQPRYQVLQLCYSHPEAAWRWYIKLVSLEKLRTELLQIFVQLATHCCYTNMPRGLLDPRPKAHFLWQYDKIFTDSKTQGKPGGGNYSSLDSSIHSLESNSYP